MATDDDVRKNTNDIHALTVNVTRLATIVENSEKRHDSDMDMMKEAVQGISRLNERIGQTVGMEKDISALRDMVSELKGDTRTLRHDLNNALNAIPGIGIVNEKLNEATSTLAAQGAKIEGLESWRDKLDGSGVPALGKRVEDLEKEKSNRDGKVTAITGIGAALWTVFGTGIIAIGFFVLKTYFTAKDIIGGE